MGPFCLSGILIDSPLPVSQAGLQYFLEVTMEVFGTLVARHQSETKLSVPEPMRQPLSADERDGLARWIRGQRFSSRPDGENWRSFWNLGMPFFRQELSMLLLGQVSANIQQCAEPVRAPSQLQHWMRLDAGQRFTLERTDACRCLFFDADLVLVMDRQQPNEAWRFGPTVWSDCRRGAPAAWQPIEQADVLDALLLTWESSQPKMKIARERLCDIADKALSLRP